MLLAVLLYLYLCALQPTRLSAQTVTNRTVTLSPYESIAIDVYQQYLSTHKFANSSSSPDSAMIFNIANKLILSVDLYYHKIKKQNLLESFSWETHLLDDKKGDAWCLPTGKMVINTGLLPTTQSEAALAVVISHQIAHVLLFHGDQRLRMILKEYLAGKDLRTAYSEKPKEIGELFMIAFGIGDQMGLIQGFNTESEKEADELGAILTAEAGYDPRETLVFWDRMLRMKDTSAQPKLLINHSVNAERIRSLRDKMDLIYKNHYLPIRKN